jgi:hypothetical protein
MVDMYPNMILQQDCKRLAQNDAGPVRSWRARGCDAWSQKGAGDASPLRATGRFGNCGEPPVGSSAFTWSVEFLPTLRRHFFSGHLWSSLVTFGHLRFPFRPGNRSNQYVFGPISDRFLPALSAEASAKADAHRPPPPVGRNPGARPKSAKKSAKAWQKCQKVTWKRPTSEIL